MNLYVPTKDGGWILFISMIFVSAAASIPFMFLSSYISSDAVVVVRATIALLFSTIVLYTFKEARDSLKKVKNYDYSIFSVEKKKDYNEASSALVERGGDGSLKNLMVVISVIVLASIIDMSKVVGAGSEAVVSYLQMFGLVTPIAFSVGYSFFFWNRMQAADDWLNRLNRERIIEERRAGIVARLRQSIADESPPDTSGNKVPVYSVEEFFNKKKIEQGKKSKR